MTSSYMPFFQGHVSSVPEWPSSRPTSLCIMLGSRAIPAECAKPLILVTGGCGFIGSHTLVELLSAGYQLVVVDNLSNASVSALCAVEDILKLERGSIPLYTISMLDEPSLDSVFSKHKIDAVIHFAALKAVADSVANPLSYYHTNVTGLILLLTVMKRHKVRRLIFSSSAAVYGDLEVMPNVVTADAHSSHHSKMDCSSNENGNATREHASKAQLCRSAGPNGVREIDGTLAVNPYGRSKEFGEQIVRDLCAAEPGWTSQLLRYFNPCGAHPSGLLGESPAGTPTNLMPYIAQVVAGTKPYLYVFGNNYPTRDGTAVRDFVHVVDLARAHVHAVWKLFDDAPLQKHPHSTPIPPISSSCAVYNLGTGQGKTVLEMARAMENASGRSVPIHFAPPRPGDVACVIADCSSAFQDLGWEPRFSIDDICRDAWLWAQRRCIKDEPKFQDDLAANSLPTP